MADEDNWCNECEPGGRCWATCTRCCYCGATIERAEEPADEGSAMDEQTLEVLKEAAASGTFDANDIRKARDRARVLAVIEAMAEGDICALENAEAALGNRALPWPDRAR